MEKRHFEVLFSLFENIDNILVITDKENLYLSNRKIAFKIPVKYKEEILSVFNQEFGCSIDFKLEALTLTTWTIDFRWGKQIMLIQNKIGITDAECKKIENIKNLFQNTDLIPAINTNALQVTATGNVQLFDIEYGFLLVNLDYIKIASEVLTQFSEAEEIKKFANRKNKFFYMKNDIVEVAIVPEKLIPRELFV